MRKLQFFRISIHFFASHKFLKMALQNIYYSQNIFLADDDEEDRMMFNEALMEVHAGAVLTEVENGKKLIDLLSIPPVPPPDVIFLDLNMPGKNGYDCIAEIRADAATMGLPVVIFTTSSLKQDIDSMFELGANFYVSKPSCFDALKNVIRKVLYIDWSQKIQGRENFVISA